MIANVGPADFNYDETMNTLRYASRAKNIQNKPRINEDPKDAMLRELQEERERLLEELARQQKSGDPNAKMPSGVMGGKQMSRQQQIELDEERMREYEAKLNQEREDFRKEME